MYKHWFLRNLRFLNAKEVFFIESVFYTNVFIAEKGALMLRGNKICLKSDVQTAA